MLLSVILLAAAVQAAPPPSPPQAGDRMSAGGSEPAAVEAVKAVPTTQACRASGPDYAVNAEPTIRAAVRKLGDLPPANHTLTVLRSVDGCPVSSTIRFNVDRPSRR